MEKLPERSDMSCYHSLAARWLSKDPIGISGGLNQYVAFGGNGVMYLDPQGEWIVPVVAVVGAFAAGYAFGHFLDKLREANEKAYDARDRSKGYPEGTMGNPVWQEDWEEVKDPIRDALRETPNSPFTGGPAGIGPKDATDQIIWGYEKAMEKLNELPEKEPCP